nr:uncharacterized protein LOC110568936 [Aotus nancymaae]
MMAEVTEELAEGEDPCYSMMAEVTEELAEGEDPCCSVKAEVTEEPEQEEHPCCSVKAEVTEEPEQGEHPCCSVKAEVTEEPEQEEHPCCSQMAEVTEKLQLGIGYVFSRIAKVTKEVKEAVGYFCSTMVDTTEDPEEDSSDIPEPSTGRSQETRSMKGRKGRFSEANESETDKVLEIAKSVTSFIQQNSERRKAGKKSTILVFSNRNYIKKRNGNQSNEDERANELPTSSSIQGPSEAQDL